MSVRGVLGPDTAVLLSTFLQGTQGGPQHFERSAEAADYYTAKPGGGAAGGSAHKFIQSDFGTHKRTRRQPAGRAEHRVARGDAADTD